jgi:hypothetical protein
MTRQWRDQEDKASLGRRDLHQKIDAMRDELQKLEGASPPRSTTSPR